ncbi:hypothetical protein AMTRI_Chr06g176400 [Amborella trichopoda]
MALSFWSVLIFLGLFMSMHDAALENHNRALSPPRGWNSYDAYSWIISEEEFLENARIASEKLLNYGYEYVVVDYLWYRRLENGSSSNALGFDVIDEWGRPTPDPKRWPSSKGGKGFKEVASKVHSMGLKFGIHVMRGISTQAVNANTPILDPYKESFYEESGRIWRARDIGLRERACAWMPSGFMSVDTELGAGKAFLRSLYQQYAEWGVDFVKHDCIFGDDLDISEISVVSEILKELSRPILYSLSPGSRATPAMAAEISTLVNMYRITGDDWDTWADVEAHFDVSRDFAASRLIGAEGLLGKSWPDMDMLPLGVLTDAGVNEGPHRNCRLTFNEQRTQMTLWSMARSPLMFGGDLRQIDYTTFFIITHPILLEINSFSKNNMEFPLVSSIRTVMPSSHHRLRSSLTPGYMDGSNKGTLGLTSCKDQKAGSWLIKTHNGDMDQVCWKGHSSGNKDPGFCMYKRELLPSLDEENDYKKHYQGKFHLLPSKTKDHCLDLSIKRKPTVWNSNENTTFPCKWDTKQMWELTHDGNLVNSYAGLCATVNADKGMMTTKGIRSWIATGRKGEIYLSFFNLNPESTIISANIKDLASVLSPAYFTNYLCTTFEVWSGRELGIINERLSMEVGSHGCALFVLKCR